VSITISYNKKIGIFVYTLQSNLRRFMELVHRGDVDRLADMINSGLDPNFSNQDKQGGTC